MNKILLYLNENYGCPIPGEVWGDQIASKDQTKTWIVSNYPLARRAAFRLRDVGPRRWNEFLTEFELREEICVRDLTAE